VLTLPSDKCATDCLAAADEMPYLRRPDIVAARDERRVERKTGHGYSNRSA